MNHPSAPDAGTPGKEDPRLESRLERAEARLSSLHRQFGELRDRLLTLEAERKRAQAELESQRLRDPYTGFPNRRQFAADLDELLTSRSEPCLAIGLVRLDQSFARNKANRIALIAATGIRIQSAMRESLFTGESPYISDRMDEFYLIFRQPATVEMLEQAGALIAGEIHKPHSGAGDLSFGCSIGLALTDRSTGQTELLENADIALAESERTGVPCVLYNEAMGTEYRQRVLTEKYLKHSIHQDGFRGLSLRYQPYVDRRYAIVGAEALMRWNHPELGTVSPVRFIPIAEQTGQIRFLGNWSLYRAARQLMQWINGGYPGLVLSVNLSASQFGHPDLVDRVATTIKALSIPRQALALEITETAIMADTNASVEKMQRLRELGVSLALDDFGTGYSSLSHLRRFPIETLKIDRSFIMDVHENRTNQEIVKAIIAMARGFGMTTLAEGVESRQELEFLFDCGCDRIQGFYFSEPVEAPRFAQLLGDGVRRVRAGA